jgi:hypothetical protein
MTTRLTTRGTTRSTTRGTSPGVPVPVNVVAPVISGTDRIGETLSCTTGAWEGSPASYAYQWQSAGVDILGATSSTYLTVFDDAGKAITCKVTATNSGGLSLPATSNTLNIATLFALFDVTDAATVQTGAYSTAGNGDAVSRWMDKSGNGRHLEMGANAPTLNTTGGPSSARAVVADAASNQRMQWAGTLNQPFSVFVVWKFNTTSNIGPIIAGSSLSGSTTARRFIRNGSDQLMLASGAELVGSDTVGEVWRILDFTANGASSSFSINNGTRTTGNAGSGSWGGLSLFGRLNMDSATASASCCEVIVVPFAVGTDLRNAIYAMLAAKFP